MIGPQCILTVDEPEFKGWRSESDRVKSMREAREMELAQRRTSLHHTKVSDADAVERTDAMFRYV